MDYIYHYQSPLGDILMAGIISGTEISSLTGLWFENQKYFAATLGPEYKEELLPVFQDTTRWLDIYFSGADPDFTPNLRISATHFRKAVWDILMTIPFGKTMTYGEIAKMLAGREDNSRQTVSGAKALSAATRAVGAGARAVGAAVGHNPISLIIPCHRVIGADGHLTGYAGGLERKRRLLALESSYPASASTVTVL